ncbi:MAG: hypothetical protein NTU83_11865 [Candidatus Hydrogenedentes bacterium]|nr:hypothetical protein [Candidatus Hydrogenedentota bacterium]
MRMIGVMIGCALILAAVPGWAGTTTINFANGIGPLSYQSGSGRLQASGGRAVFTGVNSTMLASNGSPVAANGTITATMSLNPYPDALNGVGLVMVDTSDLGNMLTAIVDGNTGQVTLMGWMELYTTVDFTYPAALNSMTLQYDVYTDRATLTLNGSQSVFLDEALGGAYSVYVGVGANGPGGFASFSATGNGIPVYPPPPEPPNGITAKPRKSPTTAGKMPAPT